MSVCTVRIHGLSLQPACRAAESCEAGCEPASENPLMVRLILPQAHARTRARAPTHTHMHTRTGKVLSLRAAGCRKSAGSRWATTTTSRWTSWRRRHGHKSRPQRRSEWPRHMLRSPLLATVAVSACMAGHAGAGVCLCARVFAVSRARVPCRRAQSAGLPPLQLPSTPRAHMMHMQPCCCIHHDRLMTR